MSKYHFVESTIDVTVRERRIRLWIDTQGKIPSSTAELSMLAYIVKKQAKAHKYTSVETLIEALSKIPGVTAIQVITEPLPFQDGGAALGTVVYMVPFESK